MVENVAALALDSFERHFFGEARCAANNNGPVRFEHASGAARYQFVWAAGRAVLALHCEDGSGNVVDMDLLRTTDGARVMHVHVNGYELTAGDAVVGIVADAIERFVGAVDEDAPFVDLGRALRAALAAAAWTDGIGAFMARHLLPCTRLTAPLPAARPTRRNAA